MMRSAWIKWARGVEHQQILARDQRQSELWQMYDYVRTDNAASGGDPLVAAHWRLKVLKPFPERWNVEVGDILTNLRAALDHTFWAAVHANSGPPKKPHLISFPLTPTTTQFKKPRKELQPLVARDFWELVEKVQPFQADQPENAPLEWLRWLSNMDKHRTVHILGRMEFDAGPIIVTGDNRYEIVDEWHITGPVQDGDVVARLKIRRPAGNQEIILTPTFTYSPALQVGDEPGRPIPLHVVMRAIQEYVFAVVSNATDILGEPFPDPDSMEIGLEHAAVAPENAGIVATFRDHKGTTHHLPNPTSSATSGEDQRT